jgi:hypothetical protein
MPRGPRPRGSELRNSNFIGWLSSAASAFQTMQSFLIAIQTCARWSSFLRACHRWPRPKPRQTICSYLLRSFLPVLVLPCDLVPSPNSFSRHVRHIRPVLRSHFADHPPCLFIKLASREAQVSGSVPCDERGSTGRCSSERPGHAIVTPTSQCGRCDGIFAIRQ